MIKQMIKILQMSVISWKIRPTIGIRRKVIFLEIETSSPHKHDRFFSFSNEDGTSEASLLPPRKRGGRVHLLWHFGRNTLCKHQSTSQVLEFKLKLFQQ